MDQNVNHFNMWIEQVVLLSADNIAELEQYVNQELIKLKTESNPTNEITGIKFNVGVSSASQFFHAMIIYNKYIVQ